MGMFAYSLAFEPEDIKSLNSMLACVVLLILHLTTRHLSTLQPEVACYSNFPDSMRNVLNSFIKQFKRVGFNPFFKSCSTIFMFLELFKQFILHAVTDAVVFRCAWDCVAVAPFLPFFTCGYFGCILYFYTERFVYILYGSYFQVLFLMLFCFDEFRLKIW